MASMLLMKVRETAGLLSPEEKLWLVDQLIHQLRRNSRGRGNAGNVAWRSHLASMAKDPDIRHEIRKIDDEFGPAEMDGLRRK